MSIKSFIIWFERSEALLECKKPDKIEFEQMLAHHEMAYI